MWKICGYEKSLKGQKWLGGWSRIVEDRIEEEWLVESERVISPFRAGCQPSSLDRG